MSWKNIELAKVCEVFSDGDWIESKDQSDIGIRLIQTGNVGFGRFKARDSKARYINEETFKRLRCTEIKEGDLLVSRLPDPVGRACIIPQLVDKSITAVDCTIIRTKQEILYSNYLNYYCQSPQYFEQVKKNITGATRQRISRSLLGKTLIPLAPLATQQKIVAKLEAIFAEIDTATAAAEASANNAKALFQSYLTEVFERGGEGWETKKLPELCTLFNGRAYKKEELLDIGKYTVLRVGNFFTNEHWYYSDLELEENKYCDNGDLLYAWSASFGPRIWDGDKVIYHYHIWKVKPNLEVIDKNFLYFLLEWDVDKIKKDHGTGTTMIHVSKTNMETRILPYIKLERQKVIVKRLQNLKINIDLLILGYKDKKIQIELLKQSILQRAFSGELVKD